MFRGFASFFDFLGFRAAPFVSTRHIARSRTDSIFTAISSHLVPFAVSVSSVDISAGSPWATFEPRVEYVWDFGPLGAVFEGKAHGALGGGA
jgi:hypothetical protein